jgi:hypothetical protein
VNKLALVLADTNLIDLGLSVVNMTDTGALSLAGTVGRSKIKRLDVSSNAISADTLKMLRDVMPQHFKLIFTPLLHSGRFPLGLVHYSECSSAIRMI